MNPPEFPRAPDANEGTAVAVIATGLLALVGSVAVQVLWLALALAVTIAAALGRRRDEGPPTPAARGR